jgi:hypothetical protein
VEQSLLSEIEFEWIRQYYVQGALHMETNLWWQRPMLELMRFWSLLEKRTAACLDILHAAADPQARPSEPMSKKRLKKRAQRVKEVNSEGFSVLIEHLELVFQYLLHSITIISIMFA